ncbi:MAG: PIN domain-containing protein [Thermodesulfobacteriota bacterium]
MRRQVILDTGPLVAFLNRQDTYHNWSVAQWSEILPPMLTCEAVLSEACFLLRWQDKGREHIFELLRRKTIHIPFRMNENIAPLGDLMKKYDSIPMSLADACLVRMAELFDESSILTLDDDFTVYRKNKRQAIPLLAPPAGLRSRMKE